MAKRNEKKRKTCEVEKLFRDLRPVLLEELDSIIGDLSAAEREDGPSSKPNRYSSSDSTRNTTGRRWNRSDLQFLELVACLGELWDLVEPIEALLASQCGPRKAGRKREYQVVEVFIFSVAIWICGSHTHADDNLADKKNWQRLRSAVEDAWPDHPERRLSPEPMSRSKHYRFRKNFKGDVNHELLVTLRRLITDMAVDGALFIGLFDPDTDDSLAKPDPTRVVTGDGTHLRGPYNEGPRGVNPRTGKVKRFDHDAQPYHGSDADLSSLPCHEAVIVSGRNSHPNERIVLSSVVMPPKSFSGTKTTGATTPPKKSSEGKTSDATMAVEMVLDLIETYPAMEKGVRSFAYDMKADSEDKDTLLDAGLTYFVKSRLTGTSKRSSCVLGPGRFVHKDGTTSKHIVTAIAGTPCLTFLADNKQVIQPLRRATLEKKERKGGWVIYGIWQVPDSEVVPKHLVGAKVRIPHNSKPGERASVPHTRRTRALSPIPESDPHFDAVYGIREDSESINSDVKRRLPNGRCRTPGAENLTFDLLGYQLLTLVKALDSYRCRTGTDATLWFGHHPPSVRAGPLRLVA